MAEVQAHPVQTVEVVEPVKINHPKYSHTSYKNGNPIIHFNIGYLKPVPDDVIEAYNKIESTLESLGEEIASIRKFYGNVVLYKPSSKSINPELTEEMRLEIISAVKETYPNAEQFDTWSYGFGVLTKYAIQLKIS